MYVEKKSRGQEKKDFLIENKFYLKEKFGSVNTVEFMGCRSSPVKEGMVNVD